MSTKAVWDAETEEWVLNGTKAWITNGGYAKVHVVVAVVDSELGLQASFVVPEGTPGLSKGSSYRKLGIRTSPTAEVVLENVRVPASCLLGGQDKLDARKAKKLEKKSGGHNPAMATFELSRPAVGAMAVGLAQAAYDYTLKYSLERKTFGKFIAEHQMIAHKLANMRVEIEAARLLVWKAGWMAASGKPFAHAEGSQAKLKAGEVVKFVTRTCVEILGGAGFVEDAPIEQWYRDAPIFSIFEGTKEIQELLVASAEAGLRIR
jgi:hypothetical protein